MYILLSAILYNISLEKIRDLANLDENKKRRCLILPFWSTSAKYLFIQGRMNTRFHPYAFFIFSYYIVVPYDYDSYVVWQLVRQLVWKASYSRYQVLFYLFWMELLFSFLAHAKKNGLIRNIRLILKFITSQLGQQTTIIHFLPNI